MNDEVFEESLHEALMGADLTDEHGAPIKILGITTFKSAGVLTMDSGLVLTLADHSRVFLTIRVQS